MPARAACTTDDSLREGERERPNLMPRLPLAWSVALALLVAVPGAAAVDAQLDAALSSLGTPGSPGAPTGGASSPGGASSAGATSSNTAQPATAAAVTGVDLQTTKTDSADPVTVGQQFTYTVTVLNDGTQAAQGFSVVDQLPANVTFVSVDPSSRCTYSAGTHRVTCSTSNGRLNAGATFSFTITVQATSAGVATNTATASTTSTDVNPGNNADSEPTTIRTAAPGQLTCYADSAGVHIDWDAVPQATSYNVYRAVGATGTPNYVLIGNTASTEFVDSSAAVGQAYRYRVTALAGAIESEPSPPCTIASVPELPTLLAGALAVVGGVGAFAWMRRR